jgi:uncharacterized RDD family membrane protein YckC
MPNTPHDDHNPFSAPDQDLPVQTAGTDSGRPLASRWKRFLGSLVDQAIIGVPVVLVVVVMIVSGNVDGESLDSFGKMAALVLYLLVYVVINGYFLVTRGQSLGKMLVKTRIVRCDGESLSWVDVLIKRYAFMQAVGLIPFIGVVLGLADVLFIFRADRRCIHDLVAGTEVIDVSPVALA